MSNVIYETHANGHWKELFKSKNKLLGGHNLANGEEICATIASVATEPVYDQETGGEKELVVLQFQGAKIPPMALNVTNADTIAMLHGHTYTQWQGKKILIHTKKVKAFGKTHDALRVRAKVPQEADLTPFANQLKACKTLAELKESFLKLPKHVQGALSGLKDELKVKL